MKQLLASLYAHHHCKKDEGIVMQNAATLGEQFSRYLRKNSRGGGRISAPRECEALSYILSKKDMIFTVLRSCDMFYRAEG